jgi:hypothetical protein
MKKIVLFVLAVAVCLGMSAMFARAEDGTAETTNVTVGVLFFRNDKINTTVNHEGDVFAAGSNVTLKGKITGNLFVAGMNVTLPKELEVRGSVFAAGQSVSNESVVYGQVYLAGSTISDKGDIYGDIKAAGSIVKLAGKYNYAYLAGENVTFSGMANYGLRMGGETNTIEDAAEINGNIKINVPKGKTATYPDKYKDKVEIYSPEKEDDPDDNPLSGANIWASVMGFLFAFVVGIAMMYIFPVGFEKIKAFFTKKIWFCLLWGFLSMLIVPLGTLLILLVFFPASIVFAIAGFLFWLVTFFLGTIVIYYWLGELLARLISKDKPMHAVLMLLIGVFAASLFFFLVRLVPVVGGVGCFIQFVLGLFGSGAVILAIFKRETPA